jgi:hypothetical protein
LNFFLQSLREFTGKFDPTTTTSENGGCTFLTTNLNKHEIVRKQVNKQKNIQIRENENPS